MCPLFSLEKLIVKERRERTRIGVKLWTMESTNNRIILLNNHSSFYSFTRCSLIVFTLQTYHVEWKIYVHICWPASMDTSISREKYEDAGVSCSAKRKLSCSSTCKVCYFFYELDGLGMLPTANVLDTVQHDVSVTIGQ